MGKNPHLHHGKGESEKILIPGGYWGEDEDEDETRMIFSLTIAQFLANLVK